MIGIIGGSGLYEAIGDFTDRKEDQMHTPYGVIEFVAGKWLGQDAVFIPRHGKEHGYPPHRVKFKANIWALNELKVERVISTCAVGTLNEKIPPGRITIPDQLIDFTKETRSFYNGGREGVKHVDLTEPFCPTMRQTFKDVSLETGLEVHAGGTYTCFSGPTFETAAEIRMVKAIGGDLVGMTAAPEAKLCREMGICYTTLCMPVNWAAGLTKEMLTHRQTLEQVNLMKNDLINLIRYTLDKFPRVRECVCAKAISA
jgi:5'-methylthioadenosine phosphorylase